MRGVGEDGSEDGRLDEKWARMEGMDENGERTVNTVACKDTARMAANGFDMLRKIGKW